MDGYAGAWGAVGVLLLVGVAFVAAAMGANRLLSPTRSRAADDPGTRPYECGVDVDPGEHAWSQTHIRYYVYAFVYVVFAVEAVFLYPWATVFADLGGAALAEMGIFVGLLALGLLYAWRKRVLTWE